MTPMLEIPMISHSAWTSSSTATTCRVKASIPTARPTSRRLELEEQSTKQISTKFHNCQIWSKLSASWASRPRSEATRKSLTSNSRRSKRRSTNGKRSRRPTIPQNWTMNKPLWTRFSSSCTKRSQIWRSLWTWVWDKRRRNNPRKINKSCKFWSKRMVK